MIDTALAAAPENHVVVQAAAGSGKTWLLASRIIRLLLQGSEPGAILAISFTRKAAGEIYERVTQRLLNLAVCDEPSLVQQLKELGAATDSASCALARDLYEKHLSALHTLRTTTFHAFCQEILRRFPLEADVPPGFELIESTEELVDAAWAIFERNLGRNKETPVARALDSLLRDNGSVSTTRQLLKDFLTQRSDWWAYTENAAHPVETATRQLQDLLQVSEELDPHGDFLNDAPNRQQLKRYAELLSGHATATHQEFIEIITHALTDNTSSVTSFAHVMRVFFTEKLEPRQIKATQTLIKKIGAAGAQELLHLQQTIGDRLLATQACYQRCQTLKLSRAWYVCGAALLQAYQRIKAERGWLDFADLEWKTYRLLTRSRYAEWVQYKLDQRIDHLLVDEFQDTNPTQWRLLLPLLEEMVAGDPERNRSIFLVGDEKQSIYRFRRADPQLFHAAHRWLQQHPQTQSFTQHISWRSSPAIIDFVNLLFRDSTTEQNEIIEDYSLKDFQAHATHQQQLWGHVELLPLIARPKKLADAHAPTWRNPIEQPLQTDEDTRHHQEGAVIANKIKEIIGMPISDKAQVRPVNGADIIILLRDRNHARLYEDALRRAGIAYTGTGRGSFLQSLEVRDLMHLLQTLIEPYNNLALASVLRSPIFAVADADLLLLAQQTSGSWFERLKKLDSPDKASAALMRAQELLPNWNGYADRIPVHDLLDRIYCESNLIARYIAAAPPHLRARVEANLNRFLEIALDVDSGRYPSLSRFLAHLQRRAQDDTETPAEPAWNREPRVRIMTIHAAKGLEAPVIFLADAARDGGQRNSGARALVEWPATDARPRYFHLIGNKKYQDDISQSLLYGQKFATQREETNLLYVALTRAKQMLFISGCEPGRGGRGWYGFIEKRLRAAEQTERAQVSRLILRHIHSDDGTIFNTCAQLKFGDPAMCAAQMKSSIPAIQYFHIDPALMHPLPVAPEIGLLHPSWMNPVEDNETDTTAPETITALPNRGIAIHRMLEQLSNDGDRTSIEKRMHREFDATLAHQEFAACWKEACAVVDHPAFRDLFEPRADQDARNEVPILYRDNGRDIYGVVDRLIIRETEIILIDYKTHAHATPQNIRQLAPDFFPQIRQYALGVQQLWPQKKIRLILLFTHCRELLQVTP
ncbi:MAG: UvrD-helicase domain-containing protein [Gammaproteobacteria bacterium]|nr:UvrD-helicase domain-containing protein [Gammaproteobacteria bacterium]